MEYKNPCPGLELNPGRRCRKEQTGHGNRSSPAFTKIKTFCCCLMMTRIYPSDHPDLTLLTPLPCRLLFLPCATPHPLGLFHPSFLQDKIPAAVKVNKARRQGKKHLMDQAKIPE
jgi:hypothetical protein